MDRQTIVVVSGLPRSGTSMMMQMLAAGGMPVLVDDARAADADNPRGYYEYGPVKRIKNDGSWLHRARGRAVKVVSPLLRYLPTAHEYKVILMHRDLTEVLASQQQMLARRNRPELDADANLEAVFRHHLGEIEAWLAQRPHLRVLRINCSDVLRSADGEITRLCTFLGEPLDGVAMARVVDPSLHHQRA